jgi:hypothetical protein
MAGSVVKDVPLPVEGLRLQLITSPNSIFYATISERTEKVKVQEPRIVQRSVMESRLAKKRECLTVTVDRSSLTEQALKDAGLMKPEEKLAKVIFRERESTCVDTDDTMLASPLDVIMVDTYVTKTIARIRTYPVDQ